MNDLFGKGDLEMTDNFFAAITPALHGWKTRVFKQLAAFIDRIVERSVLPFVKDWFGHYRTLDSTLLGVTFATSASLR